MNEVIANRGNIIDGRPIQPWIDRACKLVQALGFTAVWIEESNGIARDGTVTTGTLVWHPDLTGDQVFLLNKQLMDLELASPTPNGQVVLIANKPLLRLAEG